MDKTPDNQRNKQRGPRDPDAEARERAAFAAECRRQSLALRDDLAERDIILWLERAADRTGWRP